MPNEPVNQQDCGRRDIGDVQTPDTRTIQPPVQKQLSGAAIDRALEENIIALAPATDANISDKCADAVQYLRSRHNEPGVAYRLAEVMMTATDHKARELAEQALEGTQDEQGKALLRYEYLVREVFREICGKGRSRFEMGSTHPDQLVADLKQVRNHPLIAARLIEAIVSGSDGAYHAATVLQETSDKKTQAILKTTMATVLQGGRHANGWERKRMWQLPRALKYSHDPEVKAFIVQAFKEGNEAFGTTNFRYSAACALGAIRTDEVRGLIIDSVLDLRQDWHVRRGIVEALKEQMDDGIKAKLLPLIDGSVAKTAWLVAGEQSQSTLAQVGRWIGILNSNREQIHDIRVQVALALQEREPKLSKRAYTDALKGKRDPHTRRCHFFAAWEALRAIEGLEAAA